MVSGKSAGSRSRWMKYDAPNARASTSSAASSPPSTALQRAGEAVHAQLGQRPHVRELLRHVGAVRLQVLPTQRVGEWAGAGGAQLGGGGDQCLAHDALEVPQRLVPVEQDGFDHGATRTT